MSDQPERSDECPGCVHLRAVLLRIARQAKLAALSVGDLDRAETAVADFESDVDRSLALEKIREIQARLMRIDLLLKERQLAALENPVSESRRAAAKPAVRSHSKHRPRR